MARLIVTHGTQDYDQWRTVFDEHATTRQKYNVTDVGVFTDVEDTNSVCVIMEGAIDDLQAFAQDPDLKAAMQRAGVAGPPTFSFAPDMTATA